MSATGGGRHIRVLWIVIGSVFTIATIGFGTAQAVAGLAHEERDERTVVEGPVRVVDIVAAGSITVIGTDARDRVTVDEHISDGLQSPDRSIRNDGGRLVVRGTCGHFLGTWCSDDFVLRVPRDVRVVAEGDGIEVRRTTGGAHLTSYGGAIDVIDARGAVRLSSHGGTVTARALRAMDVDASSYGGNIDLAFEVPPRRVDASSHGGDVNVAVPDNAVSYRVDASSGGGSTSTRVRTDPEADRVIRAQSHGGDVTVRYTNEEER
jgi:hypothetical protein